MIAETRKLRNILSGRRKQLFHYRHLEYLQLLYMYRAAGNKAVTLTAIDRNVDLGAVGCS